MWESIVGRLPNQMILAFAILTYVVPYAIYKINKKLHKLGDPPWKRED